MQAFLKRNRLWPPLILSLFLLGIALFAYVALTATPDALQYLWPAPAPQSVTGQDGQTTTSNDGLKDARVAMDAFVEQVQSACDPVTLYAVLDGASVIADRDGAQAATARLVALEDGAYPLMPLTLYTGRLIYPDEFLYGNKVALVDEKLAVALFGYAEPVDRTLLLDGARYRIVGITRHTRAVGEKQEYSLYIPYRAAEKSALAMTALCIQANPLPGSGAWEAFLSATDALGKGGSAISLSKERMNAALPLRMVGCAFAVLLLLFGLRWLNARATALYRAYMARLRDQYAARLLPWAGARALPLGIGYAVCALLFAQVFIVFIAPVYTFPEWIPKVLVEPNDIAAAFWDVWQRQAGMVALRSPELLTVQFYRVLMGWACGGLALTGGMLAARIGAALRVRGGMDAGQQAVAAIPEEEANAELRR